MSLGNSVPCTEPVFFLQESLFLTHELQKAGYQCTCCIILSESCVTHEDRVTIQICWRKHVSHLHVSHCFQEQTGRLPRAGEMIVDRLDQGGCCCANVSFLQNWSQNFAGPLGIRARFGIPQLHEVGNHGKPMRDNALLEIIWDNDIIDIDILIHINSS